MINMSMLPLLGTAILIWASIFVFMLSLERRVASLEKQITEEEQQLTKGSNNG